MTPPKQVMVLLGEATVEKARLRKEVTILENDRDDLFNTIVELFNPPDDDSWSPLDAVEAAHSCLVGFPCTCVYTGPEDERDSDVEHGVFYGEDDRCNRCEVLGRYFDRVLVR